MPPSLLATLARLPETALLRAALVIIFFIFGYAKWFDYEAEAVAPLIGNSPFLAILRPLGMEGASRALGTIEFATGALLALGFVSARAALAGAALSTLTFLVTVSMLFTLPAGIWHAPLGFPALEPVPGGFLLKDLVLLAASLALVREAARRLHAEPSSIRPFPQPAA